MNRCSTVQYGSFLYLLRCVLDGDLLSEPPSRKGCSLACRLQRASDSQLFYSLLSQAYTLPRAACTQWLSKVRVKVQFTLPVRLGFVGSTMQFNFFLYQTPLFLPSFHKCQFLINIWHSKLSLNVCFWGTQLVPTWYYSLYSAHVMNYIFFLILSQPCISVINSNLLLSIIFFIHWCFLFINFISYSYNL